MTFDMILIAADKSAVTERYRSGHNEAVLKTVCPEGRVGSNPTLSAGVLAPRSIDAILYREEWMLIKVFLPVCRSTQEAEGTPLERVQVVNSGARVQIPPSPLKTCKK